MADTVENAAPTPDQPQPWAELGLKEDEYLRIREILGRRPTGAELAMYSVMWSEHCSYKSSKVHLRAFGELTQETPVGKLLAGIGEAYLVVRVGWGPDAELPPAPRRAPADVIEVVAPPR